MTFTNILTIVSPSPLSALSSRHLPVKIAAHFFLFPLHGICFLQPSLQKIALKPPTHPPTQSTLSWLSPKSLLRDCMLYCLNWVQGHWILWEIFSVLQTSICVLFYVQIIIHTQFFFLTPDNVIMDTTLFLCSKTFGFWLFSGLGKNYFFPT